MGSLIMGYFLNPFLHKVNNQGLFNGSYGQLWWEVRVMQKLRKAFYQQQYEVYNKSIVFFFSNTTGIPQKIPNYRNAR